MTPTWIKEPSELPDLDTVNDIFIELEDTKKYEIKHLPYFWLRDIGDEPNEFKVSFNYLCPKPINSYEFSECNLRFVEKRYHLFRNRHRFVISRLRHKINENNDDLIEVLLRLEDYLKGNIFGIYKGNQVVIDTFLYKYLEI
jgi:hypothetical protein